MEGVKERKIAPVNFLMEPSSLANQAQLFKLLRDKEGQPYSDAELKKLPYVPKNHPQQSEWKHRTRSLKRFLKYIHDNPRLKTVLEVGCGNGWFTYYMASAIAVNETGAKVTAMDIDQSLLERAAKVFARPNLEFVLGDVMQAPLPEKHFDLIVLNGSIQFLPPLHVLMPHLLKLLAPKGEIHIMDSPFYRKANLNNREKQTESYFKGLGLSEITTHYQHHTYEDLKQFSYKLLYNPRRKRNFVQQLALLKPAPYPWIRIVQSS
ncbi:MAG: class I SAM-dependent methyltransferase [Chitinophagales bacterium]|nr:class I SAM-dependent methyltransferase [Chitinophagales bacterium]